MRFIQLLNEAGIAGYVLTGAVAIVGILYFIAICIYDYNPDDDINDIWNLSDRM